MLFPDEYGFKFDLVFLAKTEKLFYEEYIVGNDYLGVSKFDLVRIK